MPISAVEMLIRLGTATVLGGVIGFERELRDQPAGLRTHLLVALASATFTIVSLNLAYFQGVRDDSTVQMDGTRIASNIVVGIGFLGGGAILHSGLSIKGLTTAASLWLVAAVGLAAGGGMHLLAATTTLISLFALVVLKYAFENPRKRIVLIQVQVDLTGDFVSRMALIDFLSPVGASIDEVQYRRDLSRNRSRMSMKVRLANQDLEELLMKRLEELPGVRRVQVSQSP